MKLYVFAEGITEQKVLEGLKNRLIPGLELETSRGQGKDQVNSQMVNTLGPLLQRGPVRCLVLRDLDAHVGETVATIVQSVGDAVNKMVQQRMPGSSAVTLSQNPAHPSVYTLALTQPDLRLALHVATDRWHEDFIKTTIDDYVLRLAVHPTTVGALIAEKKWPITADDVLHKVTDEIPRLLVGNGIPLQEAKDYVRLYAAVIQEHTSPPVFASKILAHAEEDELRRVYAPLLAAIEFLRS